MKIGGGSQWAVAFAILFLFRSTFGEVEPGFKNPLTLIPDITGARFSSPVALARFPPEILYADTALTVRYAFIQAVAVWDQFAMCDPEEKALTFWGKREQLPKEFCQNFFNVGEMYAYSLIRAAEREFPMQRYKELMVEAGYDPEDRSTDKSTGVGMGNVIGVRLADWLAKDGWNSMGDLSRSDYAQPFEDYTGYAPVNPPWSLKYPLRWQPLTQADSSKIGRFTAQTHVVPFLGRVRPLLISEEEVQSRQAAMPYENMDAEQLNGTDRETMDALVKDLFELSANLTPKQRFLARWWDNKFTSVGAFFLQHFDVELTPRWILGEMLAEYDAMVVVWKEKVRIDAVRPETVIANFYKDEEVTAYVPKEGKAKTIKAGDWEPLIPTQPHSEYPSASASLCTAFADHGELIVNELMEKRGLEQPPPTSINITFLDPEIREGFEEISFDTFKEAGKSCGQSRLWAGVHFGPSVPAGEKLAEGLGKLAYDFVKKLAEGEVPENCWWCETSE
ncbi:hypothetical protein BSKO_02796 [Bryopsis sp. KO-2023]|nr:hypothetical protein BSKO_02796 [Bryopsis sp. KO-2023]